MSTTIQSPAFQELAIIQRGFDKHPNPINNSGSRCRSLIVGQRWLRCRRKAHPKREKQEVDKLFSELKDMTECPKTDTFYQKMELFITYTHCKSHLNVALESFREWKAQRATATSHTPTKSSTPPPSKTASRPSSPPLTVFRPTSTSPSVAESTSTSTSLPSSPPGSPLLSPSLPPSPPLSPLTPSDEVFSTPMTDISDGTSPIYTEGGHIFDEPEADSESEGFSKQDEEKDTRLPTNDSASTPKADAKVAVDNTNSTRSYQISDLGGFQVSPKRALSLRDHTALYTAINKYPTKKTMREGFVYILQHKLVLGLFKVGFTKQGAKTRLRQSGNCYSKNTEVIYESKMKFSGARQAEKIIHASLIHHRIWIKECKYCGKGHREWFMAPEKQIVDETRNIEAFVQLPAYVEKNGEWKLSAEAHGKLKFGPSNLARDEIIDQKVDRNAESFLGVIRETTSSENDQQAEINEEYRDHVKEELSDEGQSTAVPLRPKRKQRTPLADS